VHQVKVDALLDERVAGAKKVFDRVEPPDDLRVEAGLFLHLAQRRLLRRLTGGDGAFRQSPSRPSARRNHGHERRAVAKVDDRAAG
jgi:hypothetical protein